MKQLVPSVVLYCISLCEVKVKHHPPSGLSPLCDIKDGIVSLDGLRLN